MFNVISSEISVIYPSPIVIGIFAGTAAECLLITFLNERFSAYGADYLRIYLCGLIDIVLRLLAHIVFRFTSTKVQKTFELCKKNRNYFQKNKALQPILQGTTSTKTKPLLTKQLCNTIVSLSHTLHYHTYF